VEKLLITIVPSTLILLFFVYFDRFKEPKKIIIITFLFGILITIPAGYLNDYIMITFETENEINNALLGGFFAGGLVEETLKFLVLYFYILREKEFNEPMDGIVYGTVVSLGFATLENYDYVYRLAEYYDVKPIDVAYARSYSAIPLHALCGVIMGFYFGMYAFVSGGKYLSLALIVPYIIHGSYNFLVSFPNNYFLGVLVIALVFSIFLYKNVRDSQKLKKNEHEKKII